MQTSLSDAQRKLMRALKFTEADLDANARGYLSSRQRHELSRIDAPVDVVAYFPRLGRVALALLALVFLGTLWLCGEIQFRAQNSALEACEYYQTVAPNADSSNYYSYAACLRREGYGGISMNQLTSIAVIAVGVVAIIFALAPNVQPGTTILKAVESVDGIVKPHVETDQGTIIGYYIDVAELRFQVQPEVYHAFEYGLPYRIYFRPSDPAIQPLPGTILAAESLRGT